jgi:hypothetical protein
MTERKTIAWGYNWNTMPHVTIYCAIMIRDNPRLLSLKYYIIGLFTAFHIMIIPNNEIPHFSILGVYCNLMFNSERSIMYYRPLEKFQIIFSIVSYKKKHHRRKRKQKKNSSHLRDVTSQSQKERHYFR